MKAEHPPKPNKKKERAAQNASDLLREQIRALEDKARLANFKDENIESQILILEQKLREEEATSANIQTHEGETSIDQQHPSNESATSGLGADEQKPLTDKKIIPLPNTLVSGRYEIQPTNRSESEKLIRGVDSFDELNRVLDDIDFVQGSDKKFNSWELREKIGRVRSGAAELGIITRTDGLRDK
jgi:hypothetical protein